LSRQRELGLLQGIKVTDAHSKKKIREKLAQELADKMEIGSVDDGWEEMPPDEAEIMHVHMES
jgi:hypothetical protein